ncbi:hypothetical protein HUJ04_010742, partial [Dendroctonus ponderosae]
ATNTCVLTPPKWKRIVSLAERKRKSDPSKYDRNIENCKKARVKRKSYTSPKGGPPCRLKCYEKFSDGDKVQIFERFYSFTSKNEENIYLQGLTQGLNIKHRRSREGDKDKPKSYSFKCYAFKGSGKTEICLEAFMSLHAVTYKRVRRIENLQAQEKSPKY